MSRPSLLAALLCERVLIEKDEVPSAIRIADHVLSLTPDTVDAVPVPLTLFVALRALEPCGPFVLHVDITGAATTNITRVVTADVTFPPTMLGANLIHHLGANVLPFGSYSVNVYLDDELLSRVPFTLTRAPLLV